MPIYYDPAGNTHWEPKRSNETSLNLKNRDEEKQFENTLRGVERMKTFLEKGIITSEVYEQCISCTTEKLGISVQQINSYLESTEPNTETSKIS